MVALHQDDAPYRIARPRRPQPHLRLVPPPPLPRVRADALPDHTDYRDTGCSVSPSCLACPLARCKYDEPVTPRRIDTRKRDREIALLRRKHRAPIMLLASTYGVSRRTVFRILKAQPHVA